MSDKQTLKAMFERAGIVWEDDDDEILVLSGCGPQNHGWRDCFATFRFDDLGFLMHVGVWDE